MLASEIPNFDGLDENYQQDVWYKKPFYSQKMAMNIYGEGTARYSKVNWKKLWTTGSDAKILNLFASQLDIHYSLS